MNQIKDFEYSEKDELFTEYIVLMGMKQVESENVTRLEPPLISAFLELGANYEAIHGKDILNLEWAFFELRKFYFGLAIYFS